MKCNYLIISLLLLGVSCTRNVDLREVFEEKIVIEGGISKDSIARIQITKTVNATEPDEFPRVENATVVLMNSEGEEETFIEELPGFYHGNMLKGVEGETYELSVKTSEEDFMTRAKIPVLTVDLLDISFIDTTLNDFFSLYIDFQKNKADSLYCLFRTFRNGSEISPPVFYKNEVAASQILTLYLSEVSTFISSEVFKVEIEQMEKWQYDYLSSIKEKNNAQTISGLLIGPPDNLQGNWDKGALGYFGATTTSFIEVVVP
ncbi:MAG: hypothetical protein ACI9XO_003218 [Paraglaciecola sp.]|jgi:hypothetical protein